MKSFTLSELAKLTQSTLVGNPQHRITGVDSIESAQESDATFLANPRYLPLLDKTKAGVICVSSETSPLPSQLNFLVCSDPSVAFQKLIELFLNDQNQASGFLGIHPTAVIHPQAVIGKQVSIGPYAVIDKDANVAEGTIIAAHVYIGPKVQIGSSCRIHPHVTIREGCKIGNRVIIQPGAVIGSCGFGFSTNAKGEHIKLDQLGVVVIEDDVEIGANTAIDRARFKETRIGKGTKIDNLVQIGHNVSIGPHNLIVSQTGIAGSVKTGSHVVFGGQTGVAGHLEITDQAMFGAKSGISKSITEPGKYAGVPVLPLSEHNRQQVLLRKIEEYAEKIKELEKRVSSLDNKH